jgi:SAM-dependent methyltransferase
MNTYCRMCSADLGGQLGQVLNTPKGTQFFSSEHELNQKMAQIELVSCDFCGLLQTSSDPIIYEKNSSASSFVSEDLRAHRINQALKLFAYQTNAQPKVLEVGCGDGSFLQSISGLSGSVLGIEPAIATANLAREKGLAVISQLINEDSRVEKSDYDCFFLFHVLEHVPKILPFLRGIRNNLKKGGVGCIEIPSTEAAFEAGRYGDFMPDHMSYFTLSTLKTSLEVAGFEILDIERNWQGEHLVAYVRKAPKSVNVNLIGQYIKNTDRAIKGLEAKLSAQKKIGFWGASHHLMPILANYEDLSAVNIYDGSKEKVGKYAPGTNIVVRHYSEISKTEIQYIVVSAPRFSDEICNELNRIFADAKEVNFSDCSLFGFRIFEI